MGMSHIECFGEENDIKHLKVSGCIFLELQFWKKKCYLLVSNHNNFMHWLTSKYQYHYLESNCIILL